MNYDFKDIFSENLTKEQNIKAYSKLLNLNEKQAECLYEDWRKWYKKCGYKYIERFGTDKETNIGKTTGGKTCNIAIMCVENKKEFNSINEASVKMKLNYQKLSSHMRGTCEDVKGFHFQKINSMN